MSAKGLFINSAQNGFTVEGANNVLFPDNGVLFFPFNSVIAVVDEGDIAIFRSAYNNDVLFSGLIENITIDGNPVSKEDVVDIFANVANQEGGGGGDTSGLFAGASYDSQTKQINFFNDDGDLLTYIDATAFIKDGMVDTVAIQNGNLVITFNTDAGKQPISIPLTDIFNPNNYYTKTQVDTALSAKADASSLATVATSGDYDDLTNKPTIPAAQVNADWNASSGVAQILNKPTIPDTSDFLTKAEYNPKEVAIAQALTDLNENKADKTELPDTSTFATKTELNAKQNTLTAGTGISIQNDVISATGGGGDGVYYIDFGVLTTQGIHDADWDGMVAAINAHRPIYAGFPGANGLLYYTAECLYQDGSNTIRMTASDNSAHYFYTFVKNGSEDYSFSYETRPYTTTQEKAAWNAKQDTLTAGRGITIDANNVISADDVVLSNDVGSIRTVTQSQYDDMVDHDVIIPDTLYIIVSNI